MIRPLTCPVCDKPLSPAMSAASKPQTVSGDAGSSGAVTETDADAEMCQTRASNCLPFCSERCRKIDLFRWFDGRYAIVEELSDERLASAAYAETDPLLADLDESTHVDY